jgi:microcompartment protein CcmL/EutN
MLIGKVVGYVVSTRKCDNLVGNKFMIVEPIPSLKVDNRIVAVDKVGAGIVTLTISGDVGAVKSAVEAGEIAAQRVGILRSSHVIPRMHNEVVDTLFKKEEPKVCDEISDLNDSSQVTLYINYNTSEENLNQNDEVISETVEDNLTEDTKEETNYSDSDNKESLEEVEIYNTCKDNLSKYNVKQLKAMAKKLDYSITYKELNVLKKEELINLVKKLMGEGR